MAMKHISHTRLLVLCPLTRILRAHGPKSQPTNRAMHYVNSHVGCMGVAAPTVCCSTVCSRYYRIFCANSHVLKGQEIRIGSHPMMQREVFSPSPYLQWCLRRVIRLKSLLQLWQACYSVRSTSVDAKAFAHLFRPFLS